MIFKKINLHLYYWVLTLIFFVWYLFLLKLDEAFLDINVHDTYYIVHHSVIFLLLALIYAFFGTIYWLLKNQLNKILTTIHSAITLGIIPIYAIGCSIIENKFEHEFPLFDDTSSLNLFVAFIVLLFIFAQLILVLNVLISVIKHFSNKKSASQY